MLLPPPAGWALQWVNAHFPKGWQPARLGHRGGWSAALGQQRLPKDSLPKTCQRTLRASGELPGTLAEPVWFLSCCQPQMAVWQEMATKLCFLSEARPLALLCWTASFSLPLFFLSRNNKSR